MPNSSLSPAILEARAVCSNKVFEIETLEIRHPALNFDNKQLDICFVIDTSGSMQGAIDTIAAEISQVAADLEDDFALIRYSLLGYESSGADTFFRTGNNFVDLETFQAAISAMTTTIGGIENAFSAIKLSCDTLNWNQNLTTARAIFLITDENNDNDGTTEQSVLDALAEKGVTFILGIDESNASWFQSFLDATNGVHIESPTGAEIRADLVTALQNIITIGGEEEPIYIVNDTVPHTLPLDDSETPEIVTFETRGFKLRQVGAGENGLQSLGITIDDIDRKVSQFVAKTKQFNSPVEIVFRVYLSDDLSKPQNNPPTTLFLTGSSKSSEGFSGTCSTIDIVNHPFPNQYYKLEHFPLQ